MEKLTDFSSLTLISETTPRLHYRQKSVNAA
jgi:hypothetical protein